MTANNFDKIVDITGQTCPVPLINTRRILRTSQIDEIIKFIGTAKEDISRKEILIALDNMKQEVLDSKVEKNGNWFIIAKKS